MRLLLALLVVGVPAADVALDVVLFRTFSPLAVFLYLVAAALVGGVLVRYAGPITLVRAGNRLRQGGLPGRELLDGLLLVAGGLYFVFPGPLSDALAVVLVTPGLRRLPRRALRRAFRPRESAVEVTEYRVE